MNKSKRFSYDNKAWYYVRIDEVRCSVHLWRWKVYVCIELLGMQRAGTLCWYLLKENYLIWTPTCKIVKIVNDVILQQAQHIFKAFQIRIKRHGSVNSAGVGGVGCLSIDQGYYLLFVLSTNKTKLKTLHRCQLQMRATNWYEEKVP